MNAAVDYLEPEGLFVTVDRVVHHPEAQTPPEMPHCFAYFITIHNDTDAFITIRGRKWVVKNARGEMTVVEGEGVVGEQPCIEPGGEFSYNSYHLLDTERAEAVGSYFGVDGEGRKVRTKIPRFEMVVPGGE
jgi:ApaG protein